MIDVLLVLLVTFLVALPMTRRAIDAQLPQPSHGTDGGGQIVLAVLGGGGYDLNGEKVPDDAALAGRLRDVYRGRPDRILFIEARGTVRYQRVITAMDIARAGDVRVLGIAPRR
ncbi:MAG: hypothetical protein HOQ09_14355 [Gemmatimonadaceae bacterium]|nr:hypothetical protein [Gemmatimonadaceae bacterium]